MPQPSPLDPARPGWRGNRSGRVLVVIPAFNEEEALGSLLDEIRSSCPHHLQRIDVVVIDDGSTDATAAAAASRGARVVRLCRNLGIGGAVQTGLRIAYREGYDCAVQVDGDRQHPPTEIARLIARLEDGTEPPADIVVGSRHLEHKGYQSSRARRAGQRWLRLWLRLVCRLRVTDPTSGFRAYGPRALALFQQSYPYDFPEPESLAVARARGLIIAEEPVSMRERQGGRSSIAGLKPVYYMVKVTLAVALAYARNRGRGPLRPAPPGAARPPATGGAHGN